MSDSKNQLVVQTGGAVATAENIGGAADDAVTRDEMLIPFISVLQSLSPQIVDEVEGAKTGMLFNSVTDEMTKGDEGLIIVPAVREHVILEFKPDRGGFVGKYEAKSPEMLAVKAANGGSFFEAKTEDGNDLVETFQVYVVILDADGDPEGYACLSFSASKVKKYKKWINAMLMKPIVLEDGSRVPSSLHNHIVRLTTVQETNAKGDKYYNFVLAPVNGTIKDSLIVNTDERSQMAQDLAGLVRSGTAAADNAQQAEGGAAAEGADDDNIPF